jgi:hypothetical protein
LIHDFSPHDRTQPWFYKLKSALQDRLDDHRKRNDSTKLTADETAFIRGQIAEIRALLSDMGEKPNPTIAPRRNPYN